MAKDCTMLEVSRVGIEEEDEIELSLGLSIGGSFRKSTKPKPIEQNPLNSFEKKLNSESTNVDTDLCQGHQSFLRSCVTERRVGDSEPAESGLEYVDPRRKREIHALRRQEARMKREEKLIRKGLCRGMINGGLTVENEFSEDKTLLEAQRLQNRVRDRENGANLAERACKKGKREECNAEEEIKDLNLTLNHNGAVNQKHGLNPPMVPAVPVQYSYPPLQSYVPPFTNGFAAHPYVMPFWAPNAANAGGLEKNVIQPVACRSFRPYQGTHNLSMGCDSEHNTSGKDGGNGIAASNGSLVRSSSLVSDYQSTSRHGGSSSDTGSHSSHFKPEQPQLNASSARDSPGQPEHTDPSNQMTPTQTMDKATKYTVKVVSSNITQPGTINPNEPPKSETPPDPVNKPFENPTPDLLKGASADMSKLPKTQNHDTPSLPQMPCVSTTGNGPNGKTITGFLYRYTKTEVSIICICHGSSFSPAEFVEHAGGTDISHPLRHITVIPSAFG